jgi:probable 2-oxoglutarate dehydrogenase E1 component DHKTD1
VNLILIFSNDEKVDLVCFRKHGHNELDDPTFTNPLIYKKINSRDSVPNLYEKELVEKEKSVEKEQIAQEVTKFRTNLEDSLNKVNNSQYQIEPKNMYLKGNLKS